MVLKKGKRNIRSGNTLKATNSRYSRCYSAQPVVTKQVYGFDDCLPNEDLDQGYILKTGFFAVDDGFLDAGNVVYSLNKKGRWHLPELLKERLGKQPRGLIGKSPTSLHDDDFKVTLTEHHKLNNLANCTGYYTNKGKTRQVEPCKTYFDATSIAQDRKKQRQESNTEGAYTTESPREQTSQHDVIEPQVQYDVFYPCPSTSSIAHNPKYIRDHPVNTREGIEYGQSHSGMRHKTKSKKRSYLMVDGYKGDYMYRDAYLDEDFLEEFSEAELPVSEDLQCYTSASPWATYNHGNMFTDWLDAAFSEAEGSTKCRASQFGHNNKTTHADTKQKFGKGCAIFVDSHEEDIGPNIQGNAENVKDAECGSLSADFEEDVLDMLPVMVKMTKAEVQDCNLVACYGNRYTPANALPRRFSIDITGNVVNAIQQADWDIKRQINTLDFETYLLFVRISEEDQVCNMSIQITGNLSVKSTKIKTLVEDELYTMEDVITAAAKYVTTLPIDRFKEKDSSKFSRPAASWKDPKTVNLDLMSSTCGWGFVSQLPAQAFVECKGDEQTDTTFEDVDKLRCTQGTLCNICYEELVGSDASTEPTKASALRQCLHWFCDQCWRCHLVSNIQQGMIQIHCPEYKCKAVVDLGTILCLLGLTNYRRYYHLAQGIMLSRCPTLQWCPNDNCGRVLRAVNLQTMSGPVCGSCQCGTTVCLSCLGSAHWPASCSQAQAYHQKLKQNGDESLRTLNASAEITVEVKRCPKCHQPINKNGGCTFMTCVCGYVFCWICLIDHEDDCEDPLVKSENVVIKHVDVSTTPSHIRSKLYIISVDHRKARHPKTVSQYHGKIAELVSKIQHTLCHKRPEKTAANVSSALGIPAEHQDRSPQTSNRVRPKLQRACQWILQTRLHTEKFLMSSLALNIQLHFLLEYSWLSVAELRPRDRPWIVGLMRQLDFISEQVDQILEDGGNQPVMPGIARLARLVTRGRQTAQQLISLLNTSVAV